MYKGAVLGGLVTLLSFFGCNRPLHKGVERHFVLPDSLGTLSIWLDSNLTQLGSWKHPSDYKCGAEWVECYAYKNWPMYQDTNYFSPLIDSIFQFTLRYSFFTLEECGNQIEYPSAEEMLARNLKGHHFENSNWTPVNHGLIDVHGTKWGYIITSDSLNRYNNTAQCFTSRSGRGVHILWQRIASTRAKFDFGEFAINQLESAEFN